DLSEGETVTYSVEIDNTLDQQNDSDLFSAIRFTLNNDDIKSFEGNRIPSGEKGVSSVTCVVPSDVKVTRHVDIAQRPLGTQKVGAYRKPTLNYGPLAAPWAPAPEEIVTKSEIEQIKQAIINLGGSI
ncbi:MAG: hypothetical protein L0L39_02615, partial [Atopostipes suicloacalis]|nr:hypothetical protein [Atopostipes suicloacalis]